MEESCSSNNNNHNNNIKMKQVEEEAEALKKIISGHPLYGLLVQNHMDCLKIGSIGDEGQRHSMMQKLPASKIGSSSSLRQPELDHFMEAYCIALSKLKEAMEEPQYETVAFINSMHLQLRELTTTNPQHSDPSTTSSERRDD